MKTRIEILDDEIIDLMYSRQEIPSVPHRQTEWDEIQTRIEELIQKRDKLKEKA